MWQAAAWQVGLCLARRVGCIKQHLLHGGVWPGGWLSLAAGIPRRAACGFRSPTGIGRKRRHNSASSGDGANICTIRDEHGRAKLGACALKMARHFRNNRPSNLLFCYRGPLSNAAVARRRRGGTATP